MLNRNCSPVRISEKIIVPAWSITRAVKLADNTVMVDYITHDNQEKSATTLMSLDKIFTNWNDACQ